MIYRDAKWLELSTRIAIGLMVAFFLLPAASADQRQLYQPGFLASPYSTYAAPVFRAELLCTGVGWVCISRF